MGKGTPMVAWGKPELNMKSLTESELVGVYDMMPIMFWICNFLLEQVSPCLMEQRQRSVYLEAASKINDHKILHESAKVMDKAKGWL